MRKSWKKYKIGETDSKERGTGSWVAEHESKIWLTVDEWE